MLLLHRNPWGGVPPSRLERGLILEPAVCFNLQCHWTIFLACFPEWHEHETWEVVLLVGRPFHFCHGPNPPITWNNAGGYQPCCLLNFWFSVLSDFFDHEWTNFGSLGHTNQEMLWSYIPQIGKRFSFVIEVLIYPAEIFLSLISLLMIPADEQNDAQEHKQATFRTADLFWVVSVDKARPASSVSRAHFRVQGIVQMKKY